MSEPYQPPGSSQGTGRSGKILIVVGVLAALLLVAGVGFAAKIIIDQQEDEDTSESQETTQQSERTDDEPGDEEDSDDSDSSDDRLAADKLFDGKEGAELEYRLDEHTAEAEGLGRWDHEDCSDAGDDDVVAILEEHGCEYRVEQALAGSDAPFWVGNQILAFPDEDSAAAAAEELDDKSDAIRFRVEHFDDDSYEHMTRVDAAEAPFVVASTVVTDPTDEEARAGQDDINVVLGLTHGDPLAYFIWS